MKKRANNKGGAPPSSSSSSSSKSSSNKGSRVMPKIGNKMKRAAVYAQWLKEKKEAKREA